MRWNSGAHRQPRRGKVLVLTGFSLTVLLGMVGITVDTGLLQTARRQAQNAADAAAMAAAMELYRGNTLANAKTIATGYLAKNGLTDPAVTIAVQVPQSGPYKGNTSYVEVIVTAPQSVYLMPILGVASPQSVAALAVGGYEAIQGGDGLVLLNPNSSPGLTAQGTSNIVVKGTVVVNAPGGGVDQYGNNVSGSSASIKTTGGGGGTGPAITAYAVLTAGGVDISGGSPSSDIVNFSGGTALFASTPTLPVANPLRNLPVPDASNGAVVTPNNPTAVTVTSGKSQTLNPGVYNDITINSGATVTFKPGIYILSPASNGQGLSIPDTATINAAGAMFYLTGSDYLDWKNLAKPTFSPGKYDALDTPLDGPLPPTNGSIPAAPDPGGTIYAQLSIGGSGGSATLTGYSDAFSPFNGITFYMRPRASLQSNAVTISGAGSAGFNIGGILYAEWADITLKGNRTYNGPMVVGTLSLNGTTSVTINSGGRSFGTASQVFLVE
jgi:Flp pilus assembly protein TadG